MNYKAHFEILLVLVPAMHFLEFKTIKNRGDAYPSNNLTIKRKQYDTKTRS